MSPDNMMIMISTYPDRPSAEKAAKLMVDSGLAVCAQVGADLTSFYHWDGKVQQDSEVGVSYKVLSDRFELFCGELKLQHPNEVPQMLAWPTTYVSTAYGEWAKGKDPR